MSNFECNLVADLLPIYLDKKASNDTKKLVEKHLESCPECKDMYAAMSADVSIKKETCIKRRRKMKATTKLVLGLILYVVIIILALIVFTITHVEGV